jgi:tRNA pseudouridine38-40 synthase
LRNIRVEIEYDGTRYCGWQAQKTSDKPSIQATIQQAVRKILNEEVKIIASGRTDAGVHAQAQVANFKIDASMPLTRLQEGLNALLPEDIAITAIKEAREDFHSRFSAKAKVYRYTILNRPHRSPLLRAYALFCRYPLDIKLMRREAAALLGSHNFQAFCAAQGKGKNPRKTIKRIEITRRNGLVNIEIEANGYLYNMVRNIAGTLIDIGRGELARGSLKKIIASRNRVKAGPTAAAKGLCLVKVKY